MATQASRGGVSRFFENEFVLGTARRIYLVIAGGSLLIVVIALAIAAFLQLIAWIPAPKVPVPKPYVSEPITLDTGAVAASLRPPQNIRFVALERPTDQPLSENAALGYFDADSQGALAAFPNDFDVLGGADAALFNRVAVLVRSDSGSFVRAGLQPSQALASQINNALASAKAVQTRTFTLNVVGHDHFGRVSRPTTVTVDIAYGPEARQASSDAPTKTPETTDLQRLARTIALHIDPAKTPAYFDAYQRALRVPEQCGAQSDNANFVADFAAAFDQLKSQLNASNLEPFYSGVCFAWTQAVAADNAEQLKNEAARAQAIAANMTAKAANELKNAGTKIIKNAALGIAGVAVSAFLCMSLFLAFLALENHSDALRKAVEQLAARGRE